MIGLQMTFPELECHMAHSRVSVGAWGEVMAARALEVNGYRVRTDHQVGDLTAYSRWGEIFHVEVKTARRASDKKWHFTLWKNGSQDHRCADIVILLCVLPTGRVVPFVVPIHVLASKKAVCISSWPWRYKGQLAPYRQQIKALNLETCQPVAANVSPGAASHIRAKSRATERKRDTRRRHTSLHRENVSLPEASHVAGESAYV
jgi:hypothetical protein